MDRLGVDFIVVDLIQVFLSDMLTLTRTLLIINIIQMAHFTQYELHHSLALCFVLIQYLGDFGGFDCEDSYVDSHKLPMIRGILGNADLERYSR